LKVTDENQCGFGSETLVLSEQNLRIILLDSYCCFFFVQPLFRAIRQLFELSFDIVGVLVFPAIKLKIPTSFSFL
jgi:hypothetical protein